MMNPLLAVVVNFPCLKTSEDLIEHALFYWVGPMTIALIMSIVISSSGAEKKQKTE